MMSLMLTQVQCSGCQDPGRDISLSIKNPSGFLAEINTSESTWHTAGKNTQIASYSRMGTIFQVPFAFGTVSK